LAAARKNMPKLFLTGATGFVGHYVAACFRDCGWNVTALVRQTSSTDEVRRLGVKIHVGDMLSADTYQPAIESSDAVVHCAGLIKALGYDQFHRVNAEGASEVARAAERSGVARFVHISSIAAAGPTDSSGKAESQPVSNYGMSKLEGERKVLEKARGMQVCVVRPPIIYGPRDTGMLPVFKMAHQGWFPMFGNGTHQISIVHIDDLARAVFDLASNAGKLPEGPFYPEDGSNPTWRILADSLELVVDRKLRRPSLPPFLFHGAGSLATFWSMISRRPTVMSLDKYKEMAQPFWKFSHKSLTRAIGWVPRVRLSEGFHDTYKWYRDNGWL